MNAYYPLVGLELGGALELRVCVGLCCAVWCLLCCVCSIYSRENIVVDHFLSLREAIG